MPKKPQKPKAKTSWMQHLAAHRKKNPNKSMKVCMKDAAKTYKKH